MSASFYYYWDDRLNCQRALTQALKRGHPEQTEKMIRARFGCGTVENKPKIVIDGIGFHSCLCNYIHPLYFAFSDLAHNWEKGILPDRGAYMDQPAQALEAIQLITRLKSEAVAEAQEKERKKNKHGRKQRTD